MLHANCLPIHHSLLIIRLKSNRIGNEITSNGRFTFFLPILLLLPGFSVAIHSHLFQISPDTISRKFRNKTGPVQIKNNGINRNDGKLNQKFQYFMAFYWTPEKPAPITPSIDYYAFLFNSIYPL